MKPYPLGVCRNTLLSGVCWKMFRCNVADERFLTDSLEVFSGINIRHNLQFLFDVMS